MDVDQRPAELLDPAVLPDPGAVVERAVAVGALLDDQADGELLELHRDVEPPHALERRVGRRSRRLRLPHGADPPGAVPAAEPGGRVDGDLLAVDHDGAAPGAQLGEALGVEGDPAAGAQHVRLLLDDVAGALPGQVGGDPLGLLEDDPDLLERVGDLDAVVADVRVHPVLVDQVGEVHGGLLAVAGDQEERVLGAEVGVVAQPGDHEDVAGAVVGVEVGAVVEVAVAAVGLRQRQRRLVQRELVQRADAAHVTLRPRSRSRSMSGLWWKRVSMSSGRSISPKWICRAPVRMKTMHHWTPL